LTIRPSQAVELDHAVDELLAGKRPVVEPTIRPLLDAAALVRAALPPIPGADRFESRLLTRLAREPESRAAAARRQLAQAAAWRPGRAVAAGAVSSAALGITVTVVAVWRSRRHAAAARMGS
jgi:hypothetical protein